MPVLPDVASISVSPGLMSPRFSASTIIDSAGRSLTDPAGLLPSSFARIVFDVAPGRRVSRTSGVWPILDATRRRRRARLRLRVGHVGFRGALRRRGRDRQLRTLALDELVAESLHLLQVVDRLERPVGLAVLDDRLRLGRPDAGDGDELVARGGVEVDGGLRGQRGGGAAKR